MVALQVVRIFCAYESYSLGVILNLLISFIAPLLIIRFYEPNYRKVYILVLSFEIAFLIFARVVDGPDILFGLPSWITFFSGSLFSWIAYKVNNTKSWILICLSLTSFLTIYLLKWEQQWIDFYYGYIQTKDVNREVNIDSLEFVSPGMSSIQKEKGFQIIYFWTSTCIPCRKSLPQYLKYADYLWNDSTKFYVALIRSVEDEDFRVQFMQKKVIELFAEASFFEESGINVVPTVFVYHNFKLVHVFDWESFDTFINDRFHLQIDQPLSSYILNAPILNEVF